MSRNSDDPRKQSLQQRQMEQFRRLLVQLPEICQDYFIDIEPQTSILTRINYAYDLRVFFDYAHKTIEDLADKSPRDFTVEDLKKITSRDISYYLEYLNLYTSQDTDAERMNQNQGKKRKLVAVRAFFRYLHVHGMIENNITEIVHVPKIAEKPIVYLDADEVSELIRIVYNGEFLSAREKKFHQKTQKRDLAIFALLLGTGIRVSECVGINRKEVNLRRNSFQVHRKGGKIMELYFGDQVRAALLPYWEEREQIEAFPGSEDALFLSLQRRRITSRAVENLVTKYARGLETLAHITPHKFRSTFGTALYRSTGDIYLVADVLGHKDVNVTKRHYASIDEKKRRDAADVVSLGIGEETQPNEAPSPNPPGTQSRQS